VQGRHEHCTRIWITWFDASRGFVCSNTRSTRVIARSVRGYADGGGGLKIVQEIFQMCFDVRIHASITFKKKWKPVLRETLDEKKDSEGTRMRRRGNDEYDE